MFRSDVYKKSQNMPDFTAGFDSATAMVMSVSQFLEGKGFPGTGAVPSSETFGKIIDFFPDSWKKKFYAKSGKLDGFDPEKMSEVDVAELEKWVTNCYPDRKYPAIAIGSANGALVHLYAALGIPWLPQTFMIPVKKPAHLDKDHPKEIVEWARKPSDALLSNNPGLELHHMMDPNHDRLHLNSMTYFRVKKTRLGKYYQTFLKENLAEGGTILMINCRQTWPVKRLSNRQVFQFGGAGGGIDPKEYYEGSEQVRNFLKAQNAPVEVWDAPKNNDEAPEAEWGYQHELDAEIKSVCRQNNFQLQEIAFNHAEQPSSFVADLYRNWYRKLGRPDNQLLIECFALHDPFWAIKTASVPLWLLFNDNPSADFAEKYLQRVAPYDDIYMMIMSHGIDSIGLADISRWDKILANARKDKAYIGVDREEYPQNFGVYMSYYEDLQDKIPERYDLPEPLSLHEARAFLENEGSHYQMSWQTVAL